MKKHFSEIQNAVILGAWLALAFSFLSSFLFPLRAFALGVLTLVFIIAILGLPFEFEVSNQTFFLLKHSQQFQIDELVRLKKLLRIMRLEGISQLVRAPLRLGRFVSGGIFRGA